MPYDVVIVGGGPAGLAGALTLGRARKRVLLLDSGPRRNALAQQLHNFVTRDGTPPAEFREIGRAQLAPYTTVETRDMRAESIEGARGAFRIALASGDPIEARRVLLCTGLLDEMLPIEGFRELWGRAVFQCPYCHGYEERDRTWGYLALPSRLAHLVPFALQTRGWTKHVVVFANGLTLADDARAQLQAAQIRIVDAPVSRLVAREDRLEAVALADQTTVPCDVLFAHPPQQQVELVRSLGVELDDAGFVKTDPMKRETSIHGIYAGGDLATPGQSAIFAAAAAVQAAAMINLELTMELATSGAL